MKKFHFWVTLTNLCDITIDEDFINEWCKENDWFIEDSDYDLIMRGNVDKIVEAYIKKLVYEGELSLLNYNDCEIEEV